jgi:hypothetical protein
MSTGVRSQPDGLAGPPGDLDERLGVGVVAVSPGVAEDEHGRAPVDGRAVLVEELPERQAVVRVRVDVEQVATEHRAECLLHRVVGEQLRGLDEVGHERERSDLTEQVLQAVHEVQGEPGGCPHRQAHIGQHHQPRPVLRTPDRDGVERHAVVDHVAAHRASGVDPARWGDPAAVGQRAVQGFGQPAQGVLQLHPLGLARPVELRGVRLLVSRLDDPLLEFQQPLEVLLDRLREVGQHPGESPP